MGAAASMPAARAAAWENGITHAQRVTRLYRTSLRNSRDWSIDYEVWLMDCRRIQARFQENKHKSLAEGRDLCAAGMQELMEKRHPDPYIPIYKDGSSKYQRNVPPPPEVRMADSLLLNEVGSLHVRDSHLFLLWFTLLWSWRLCALVVDGAIYASTRIGNQIVARRPGSILFA